MHATHQCIMHGVQLRLVGIPQVDRHLYAARHDIDGSGKSPYLPDGAPRLRIATTDLMDKVDHSPSSLLRSKRHRPYASGLPVPRMGDSMARSGRT
ncbi:hypothetical protein B0E45_17390 [Sinorhizobium sp. A49]|nr:hypothetical protein B0E45_17390 [Sinorhizobium sp. A49]